MPSDPFRLHQTSTDLVYAGLRSGSIVVDDLRTPQNRTLTVGVLPTQRLVTGVRRLNDAAVPYGLVAAGLDSQLVLFDVRFSTQPLLQFAGHVNPSIPTMGFATSPDDTVVFAGGSDHRLRAWVTVTGEPLRPRSRDKKNPLVFNFEHLVEHIDISPNLTVRTANKGDILRFEHWDNPREMQRWTGGNDDYDMS
jgi:WD repeat-containing protein 21A